jgi:hypothetical protein
LKPSRVFSWLLGFLGPVLWKQNLEVGNMEAVGRPGWSKAGLAPAMNNGSPWVSVVMRTRSGPTRLEERLKKELEEAGWKVEFVANWWSSSYGVALFEAEREGEKKVLLVKWASGDRDDFFEVREASEAEGMAELYSLVDMVSDDLMYDSVLRSMMDRY